MLTPTCFGTGVPSAGSLLKHGCLFEDAIPSINHAHCHDKNIKIWVLPNTVYLDDIPLDRIEVDICVRAPDVLERPQAFT